MPRDKLAVEKEKQLTKMVRGFCGKYLDDEYSDLCVALVQKLSRKRNVPFVTGKMEIWAAAIVHAIGTINFLFDKNTKPYASPKDICDYFKTSQSTTGQKSAMIRNMLKLQHWDPTFSTEHMLEHSPYAQMALVNGFLVPVSNLFDYMVP
jgi:hypothetical protein